MVVAVLWILLAAEYKQTGVFTPLGREEIAVAENGEILILNRTQAEVVHYDANGNHKRTFQGGTERFLSPFGIRVWDKRICVIDLGSIIVFNLKGEEIDRMKPTRPGMALLPTREGILEFGPQFDHRERKMLKTLIWRSQQDSAAKILGKFEMNEALQQPQGAAEDSVHFTFNPARAESLAITDMSGRFLLVKGLGDAALTVYDLTDQCSHHADLVLPDRPRAPFNRSWANEKLKRLNNHSKDIGTFVPDYPETFPLIRAISCTSGNLIEVSLWSENPEQPMHLYYDWDGRKAKPNKYALHPRVLHLTESQAYILTFDSENRDYGILSVPTGELETTLKTLPALPMQVSHYLYPESN